MNEVGKKERITQDRVIKLFKETLGYKYLGNWHKREDNRNIEKDTLITYLTKKGYNESQIKKAIHEIEKVADNQIKSLYDINKEFYSLLRYGVKVKEGADENYQTIFLIDWNNPLKNEFAIAEEVSIKGESKKRPDLVLYINGIAIGVIELKRSIVSVEEGIRQNIGNQQTIFIKSFFSTIQLIIAGNDTEGVRYGTIETAEKYYLKWKEDEKADDKTTLEIDKLIKKVDYILDKNLISLCYKARLIEMIHNFVVFDSGIKKLCRPNQFFGVKAAINRIKKREGGIIWHTQGSGKSLTMVWLAKWIRENISDSRLLIVTDRDELDDQIKRVFLGVEEEIYRTISGKDLLEKLNNTTPLVICSLIHKFGRKEEADYDEYINDLKINLPKDFRAKGNIFVFVDECHRTQSGKLHKAMKEIINNALFIGFTGTPLLKQDKQTSIETFGSYIHTYKFDEAVKDNVILDLQYEARDVDQNISSQQKIDEWFEAKTKGLTEYAKAKLKEKWGTLQKVLSSKSRLEKIVNDIIFDMETKDRLQNGRGNAMLVASSIHEAFKYYELFQSRGFEKCAVISSYAQKKSDLDDEYTGEIGTTMNMEKYKIYEKMLNGKDAEEFEKEAKDKFIHEPAQMKLLIVVDKLLTGFDAPPATFLYIDKNMRDHGLFQAICRVNRLDGEDKRFGYIIDYKDLFKSLEQSIIDYTSEAFDNYDKEDVKGLLTNRLDKAKEQLENALESIRHLCEPVPNPKDTLSYIRYFCAENTEDENALKENEQKRLTLYKLTASLSRAFSNIANDMQKAGYSINEIEKIRNEVKYYENIRLEVMHSSGDYIDLKKYESSMRHLIDCYINAEDSQKISAFDNGMTLIDLIVDKDIEAIKKLPKNLTEDKDVLAEVLENNIRSLIIDEISTNPKYYEEMSKLLNELIELRKKGAIDYKQYLKKIMEHAKKVKNPSKSSHYPKRINTNGKRALYDNLGKDEELALSIDNEIIVEKLADWVGIKIKEKVIINAIKKYIQDEKKVQEIFEIVKNQGEYR